MQLSFWIVLGIVFKLPVIGMCWFCWWAIKSPPDQVLGEGDGGLGSPYDQGPRLRGPRSGVTLRPRTERRGDLGHDESHRPVTLPAGHAPASARRGD